MTSRYSSIVIEFPASRVRPATPRIGTSPSADVVIFTGVRIERLPDEPQGVPTTGSGITRRGRRVRR
jgi:hypothetical protein